MVSFFVLWPPIPLGDSTGPRVCPFLGPFSLCVPSMMVIPRALTRSIDIKLGVFPEGTSIFDTAKALRDYFAKEADFEVVAIQQCPNRIARVTFEEGGEAAKADFQDEGSIRIFGVECEVVSPAPPVEKVLVYNFPYENSDGPVHRALSDFGSVEGISYQTWVGLPGIHTGTRVVKMVRSSPIPRSLVIGGVRCKIWYRGQPVTCDVCREVGHVAAKCPNKGRCFHCRQQGHMARDCPDRSGFYGRGAWGPLPNRGLPVSEPGESAGGGPPVVEAHHTEPVSVAGVGPSSQTLSSPAPPSSGGGVSLDGGVTPVSVPESEPNSSVCGDSSAASTVLNSQGYIINNGNANVIDNAFSVVSDSCKVSNSSNASVNVSNSNICAASSASNAININKLDNGKAIADNGPKSCSSADLISNVLGEPVPDASVEVSPASSVDAEMTPASNHRKRSAPKPPLEDSAVPSGFAPGSSSNERGKSKISKKTAGPPGCHSLPASVSLAARTASSRGPPS